MLHIKGKADDLDQAIGWPLLLLLSHRSKTAGGTQQLCVDGLDPELLRE